MEIQTVSSRGRDLIGSQANLSAPFALQFYECQVGKIALI